MKAEKAELRKELANLETAKTVANFQHSSAKGGGKRDLTGWLIFAVVFVAVSLLVGVIGRNVSRPDSTTYTAPDGWSASFPGTPKLSTGNQEVEGVEVPYTQYETEFNNGATAYMVQTVDYPSGFNMSIDPSGELDGAISGMAGNSGATLISKSNSETFQGDTAKEATFKVSQDGSDYDIYSMNFIHGNQLYTLMTIGESKDNYDQFVRSFSL